jgi:hypothetical protein
MESEDSDNYTRSPFYKGLCPCGFFCKECLRMAIADGGWKAGLSEHIQCHTLLGGKIFMWQILHYGCTSGSEEWNRKKDKNICISVWKSPV